MMTVYDVWCLLVLCWWCLLLSLFSIHFGLIGRILGQLELLHGQHIFLWFSWPYAKSNSLSWPSSSKVEFEKKKKTQSFRPIATLPRTLNFTSKFARYGSRSGIHGGSVVRVYLVKAPQCHISLCIVCAIIYWKFRMLIPINMKIRTEIHIHI